MIWNITFWKKKLFTGNKKKLVFNISLSLYSFRLKKYWVLMQIRKLELKGALFFTDNVYAAYATRIFAEKLKKIKTMKNWLTVFFLLIFLKTS